MERLPYIDAYERTVPAPAAQVWAALVSVIRHDLSLKLPAPIIRAWGLDPSSASGEWNGNLKRGDTILGFVAEEVRGPERLALGGRHRFSRYALIFELESTEDGTGTRIRAESYAVFPGLLGRGYRLVVIGSRGHRVLVQRLLRRIAERS
jgi:hypothetical protein